MIRYSMLRLNLSFILNSDPVRRRRSLSTVYVLGCVLITAPLHCVIVRFRCGVFQGVKSDGDVTLESRGRL